MMNKQRFQIGQTVEVSSTFVYADEWLDEVLTIIGVRLLPNGDYDYTTIYATDFLNWQNGKSVCTYDGWRDEDLTPK